MSQLLFEPNPAPVGGIQYPESDGRPLADNTLQFEWITTIKWGLDWEFRNDPEVFVAGDLLWYPVEGRPDLCVAPDILLVRGRPKGHRGFYQQWAEGHIPPQVVFEVLSPSNTPMEIIKKLGSYSRYGFQEYYIYDPARRELEGFER